MAWWCPTVPQQLPPRSHRRLERAHAPVVPRCALAPNFLSCGADKAALHCLRQRRPRSRRRKRCAGCERLRLRLRAGHAGRACSALSAVVLRSWSICRYALASTAATTASCPASAGGMGGAAPDWPPSVACTTACSSSAACTPAGPNLPGPYIYCIHMYVIPYTVSTPYSLFTPRAHGRGQCL